MAAARLDDHAVNGIARIATDVPDGHNQMYLPFTGFMNPMAVFRSVGMSARSNSQEQVEFNNDDTLCLIARMLSVVGWQKVPAEVPANLTGGE